MQNLKTTGPKTLRNKDLISIIILSYNVKDLLEQTLTSLKKSIDYAKKQNNHLDFEVIVVDNNSSDGADKVAQKYNSWLKVINNKENRGFAAGNNVGVKKISSNSKYVLFLNNDIILDEDNLYIMHKFMVANPEVGLATCRVDLWSGGYDIDSHRGFPTPWRSFCYFTGLEKFFGKRFPAVFGQYHLLNKDLNTVHEIDACLGAYMLLPKTLGDKINWWPEDYFLNGEDLDFCYQIKELQKKKIMWVPLTKAIHYKGASKGTKKQSKTITTASQGTKNLQINSGINSMKIFYKKYYESKYPKFITSIIYLGIWLLHTKRSLTKSE